MTVQFSATTSTITPGVLLLSISTLPCCLSRTIDRCGSQVTAAGTRPAMNAVAASSAVMFCTVMSLIFMPFFFSRYDNQNCEVEPSFTATAWPLSSCRLLTSLPTSTPSPPWLSSSAATALKQNCGRYLSTSSMVDAEPDNSPEACAAMYIAASSTTGNSTVKPFSLK